MDTDPRSSTRWSEPVLSYLMLLTRILFFVLSGIYVYLSIQAFDHGHTWLAVLMGGLAAISFLAAARRMQA